MKTLFLKAIVLISLALVCGTYNVKAQDYSRDGKVFKTVKISVSDDIKTNYTWEDKKGNSYPIILHKVSKGSNAGKYNAYVLKKSEKTGNTYKYYIPKGIEIASEISKEMGLN